jgi:lysophospholipase L1-like esterase
MFWRQPRGAQVSHLKGLARISGTSADRALEQIAVTPPHSRFLVLGTNDANGIARRQESIDDIVHAAEKKDITVVRWAALRGRPGIAVRRTDVILRDRLPARPCATSARDAEMPGAFHEPPDGVHLKTKGYVHMWRRRLPGDACG